MTIVSRKEDEIDEDANVLREPTTTSTSNTEYQSLYSMMALTKEEIQQRAARSRSEEEEKLI